LVPDISKQHNSLETSGTNHAVTRRYTTEERTPHLTPKKVFVREVSFSE